MRILLALMLAAGCTSDAPVNIAGDYTIATTNGADGCQFGWTVGATATGIPLTMTQQDSQFTAVLGGLTRVFVDLWLGTHTFIGTVTGADFNAGLAGVKEQMPGQCVYNVNATIAGSLIGDALSGTLDLTTAIVTSASDCPPAGCHSTLSFNGTRPPH